MPTIPSGQPTLPSAWIEALQKRQARVAAEASGVDRVGRASQPRAPANIAAAAAPVRAAAPRPAAEPAAGTSSPAVPNRILPRGSLVNILA